MHNNLKFNMSNIFFNYYNNFFEKYEDPRTKNWTMISSPIPTLTLVTIYIIFVKKIGPKFMEKRKPYEIKKILIFYNALHCILSATFFYLGSKYGWLTRYNFKCVPFNHRLDSIDVKNLNLSYWFFMSRFLEFCDTIFFVLRKKNNQISTLHVVHHSIVPIIAWFGMKLVPIGHYTFAGYVNAFVHMFMYFYYMLAALGPEYKKYLWWKKYLTTLQLVQFVIVLLHTLQTLIIDCDVPKLFAYIIASQAILFFGLFFKFYRIEFKNKSKKD